MVSRKASNWIVLDILFCVITLVRHLARFGMRCTAWCTLIGTLESNNTEVLAVIHGHTRILSNTTIRKSYKYDRHKKAMFHNYKQLFLRTWNATKTRKNNCSHYICNNIYVCSLTVVVCTHGSAYYACDRISLFNCFFSCRSLWRRGKLIILAD